jgi:hypothetical protein
MEVDRVPAYRVLVGLDYPPDRRAEPGDVVEDLPAKSIKWLTEQGLIEPAGAASKPGKPAPAPEPEGDED